MVNVNSVNVTPRRDTPVTINMPALHDAIVAILTTVGIAVAVSLALVAIGAFVERGKARTGTLTRSHSVVAPAQHPTQTDDTRELVSR
jgi:hypothetical protein